jgi:hypothetical protein
MAENKTRPTGASVESYIASRANAQQRADCRELMALFKKLTRDSSPRMWGPSIVGYGSYRYTSDSGRTGEAPLASFAIRGRELVVYVLVEGEEQRSLLSKLGKHKMGKVCLYFKQLADLDRSTLEKLVAGSIAEVRRRHGWTTAARSSRLSAALFRFPEAARRDPAIDAWFTKQAPELGAIARRWFLRMRSCGRDVREVMHDGCPTACARDAAFGYVGVYTAHANVGFFHGADLEDPTGLLQGSGKRMRHVKLKPGVDLDAAALEALIRAAYADIQRRLVEEQGSD